MARLVWQGEDPLASCFIALDLQDEVCRVIVGIMEDTRYTTIEDDPTPMFQIFGELRKVVEKPKRCPSLEGQRDHRARILQRQ